MMSSQPGGEFAVELTAAGSRPIAVIKVVREMTGVRLHEAKQLVDRPPSMIATFTTSEAAQQAMDRLAAAGASTRCEGVGSVQGVPARTVYSGTTLAVTFAIVAIAVSVGYLKGGPLWGWIGALAAVAVVTAVSHLLGRR